MIINPKVPAWIVGLAAGLFADACLLSISSFVVFFGMVLLAPPAIGVLLALRWAARGGYRGWTAPTVCVAAVVGIPLATALPLLLHNTEMSFRGPPFDPPQSLELIESDGAMWVYVSRDAETLVPLEMPTTLRASGWEQGYNPGTWSRPNDWIVSDREYLFVKVIDEGAETRIRVIWGTDPRLPWFLLAISSFAAFQVYRKTQPN